MELVAVTALVGQSRGPVHDGAVAGTAPVRGDLFGPLVRGAQRMGPAHGVVVVGVRGAEIVDLESRNSVVSMPPMPFGRPSR